MSETTATGQRIATGGGTTVLAVIAALSFCHMQEGGRYRFSMPQRLAFTNGSPPGWPKDSDLHFEVQVRKVVPGGAAMMGGGPPAQPR